MKEASALIETANQNSLDAARRIKGIQAVNSKVVGVSTVQKKNKDRQDNQACWHFHNYCNAEFWATVRDPLADWNTVAQT
eukprot:3502507-Pyramimonas_sp.AAC.1